ncbi:eukaryotic translation initiation factor 2 subunit beta [Paraphaeosphaeria sporulosa]|uniref:Eukaryotic translation initiation factor 2 subunit beta n=1 Tax=Paraphaeosphaeria sporulosa TaxID=1460663 RepID=A0A177CG00_9PLEO|nr:eukaryotic translation initiation factor 2 subunit beta [Paraphaeosphaeria sporulosa]OAG06535.1 eukaryotic translation initiation factor 2 subunit beta [Paraphaeosphaeria sporulosa]
MAAVAESAERKPRKSVAFENNTTIVDSDGQVTESAAMNGDKESAASHTAGTSLKRDDSANNDADAHMAGEDKAVDEVTDMFAGLNKKKKKKPKTETEGDDAEDVLSGLKKKKKSKKPKADTDDFEAQLAAKVGDEKEEDKEEPEEEQIEEGDMMKGTGIWAHDQTKEIPYNMLLNRFFTLLHSQHPDLASSGSKSYKIPPPQCLREGNKKTIFANISEICKRMKRTDEHVTQFLFAELGTSGSVDGSRRLVIKGRFQQKQIENVLRRYIVEYVSCKTCRSPDSDLTKGENRLYFVTCNSCGSRRSVSAIKTGFSAQVGKRRRQQG